MIHPLSKQALDDYFAALERLKRGRATRVPKGTKITNDSVSLEAGKGKGSIKKSRASYAELIVAIDAAAVEQASGAKQQQQRLDKAKTSAEHFRECMEAGLAREVSLLHEVYSLKKQLAQLTGANVLPLRSATRKSSSAT